MSSRLRAEGSCTHMLAALQISYKLSKTMSSELQAEDSHIRKLHYKFFTNCPKLQTLYCRLKTPAHADFTNCPKLLKAHAYASCKAMSLKIIDYKLKIAV
jgi:hypothetical protein